MKRIRILTLAILMLIVFTTLLIACSPANPVAQFAGPLDSELKLIILIFITGIVTRLFELLATKLPPQLDPRQYTTQVAAALAGIVVLAIEAGLRLIDPALDSIVVTVMHLLTLILGGVGTLFILKQYRTPGFRE